MESYIASHEKSFMRDETSNETNKPVKIGAWGTICSGKIFDTGEVAVFPVCSQCSHFFLYITLRAFFFLSLAVSVFFLKFYFFVGTVGTVGTAATWRPDAIGVGTFLAFWGTQSGNMGTLSGNIESGTSSLLKVTKLFSSSARRVDFPENVHFRISLRETLIFTRPDAKKWQKK